jgi:ribosomal-protein-alanine N-acetyltransferase
MTIRPGRADDIDAIVRIFRACWLESYRDLLSEDVRNAMSFEIARDLWLPVLTSKTDRETLVACIDEDPIGMARIGCDPDFPDRGHLFSLYIEPRYAGKGFGSALLTSALDRLSERGFKEISLWVFKANLGALGLYKKMGFEPTDRERTDTRWKSLEIEMLHEDITSLL